MAEVTGPISTLPGTIHDLPEGTMCDRHPERRAICRVQGETDSFGAELNDLCRECLDEDRRQMREADHSGRCDWCHEHKPSLRPRRDYEEGMYGRVYYVCDECIQRVNARDQAYLDSRGYD